MNNDLFYLIVLIFLVLEWLLLRSSQKNLRKYIFRAFFIISLFGGTSITQIGKANNDGKTLEKLKLVPASRMSTKMEKKIKGWENNENEEEEEDDDGDEVNP